MNLYNEQLSRECEKILPGSIDCPYLMNPLQECYCRNLCSSTIPKAVQYCLNRHKSCPVRDTVRATDDEDSFCNS